MTLTYRTAEAVREAGRKLQKAWRTACGDQQLEKNGIDSKSVERSNFKKNSAAATGIAAIGVVFTTAAVLNMPLLILLTPVPALLLTPVVARLGASHQIGAKNAQEQLEAEKQKQLPPPRMKIS